jgi:hypothetical protein
MFWKVIEQPSGHICALAAADAEGRPTVAERLIWEGDATDSGDALRKAYAHDPSFTLVDLRSSFDQTPGLWQISSRLVWGTK